MGILLLVFIALCLPIGFLVVLIRVNVGLARLTRRIERLESLGPASPGLPPVHAAAVTVAPAAPEVVAVAPAPRLPGDRIAVTNLEQLVGGVWLQNAGSVLLLVGVFLMILWGYTSHRIGAGALVLSGVGLGLALMWRGDRIARTVAPFGQALFGVGLGVVYLTLYLGHVRLGVLPAGATFALLVAVACGSVLAGHYYRVQSIATLGVIGAFLPFLLAAWLPLSGLRMSPGGLIAYVAIVNAFVIVMAVRAGWSGLDVLGILCGTLAWIWSFHAASWGWGIEIALSLLFSLLGLAPLPRLVGREGRVRPMDLAAIALAPVCLVGASWPFLAGAARESVAMLLLSVAAVHLVAAVWVDSRRPERDLWRPLTAAAIVLLAAALERALGTERAAMAWCLEGVVLLALGLTRRGGWLRLWGSLVVALGVLWHLSLEWQDAWDVTRMPILHPAGLRGLACIVALLTGGLLLSRRRDVLRPEEHGAPDAWTATGHFLLLFWSAREAAHLAAFLAHGVLAAPAWLRSSSAVRAENLEWALQGTAWMAQATALAWALPRRGSFLKWCVAVIGVLALGTVVLYRFDVDTWGRDMLPVLNVPSLLDLASVALAVLAAVALARRRDAGSASTYRMAEAWAVGASIAAMTWSSREAGHLAQVVITGDSRLQHTTAAALTSGAWLLQATALLVLGWTRRSPFLRWCGLILYGMTACKFMLVDLQAVDVFWRFATAIAMGGAMLAISYSYRRRSLAPREVGLEPQPQAGGEGERAR